MCTSLHSTVRSVNLFLIYVKIVVASEGVRERCRWVEESNETLC